MNIQRKKTKSINLGQLKLGANAPIIVQSMTNTDTRDIEATVAQINRLVDVGCEAVRVAVLDDTAGKALVSIRKQVGIPLIADIHFDYRLAIMALEAGFEGLRLNPGNIGGKREVDLVVDAAKARGACIRIGVNSGSVHKELLKKYGGPTPAAMVESCLEHVRLLEERNFDNLKLSLKSSSVLHSLAAYEALAEVCDYPLHLGITEAGGLMRGTVKSSVGMGIMLAKGLGDTIRVSLTADPVEEIPVAFEILRALGLRSLGPEIISCPTCGRTEIDLFALNQMVEQRLQGLKTGGHLKIAVMGCVVNGPGEAREADLGLAGGRQKGIIFKKGEIIRNVVGMDALVATFMEELEILLQQNG